MKKLVILALVLLTALNVSAPSLPFFGRSGGGGGGASLPLTNSLAEYWNFNDNVSGTFTNSVPGGDVLTITGAPQNNGADGVFNNAFGFATDKYATLADNATIGIGSGKSFTLSAWVQPSSAAPLHIAGKWNASDSTKQDYQINFTTSDPSVHFQVVDLGGNTIIVTNHLHISFAPSHLTLPNHVWVNVMGGYDDTNKWIWIQVGNSPRITQPCTGVRRTSCAFTIGTDAGHTWNGNNIDEVAFWTRSLTTQDVANYCNSLLPFDNNTPGVDYPNLGTATGNTNAMPTGTTNITAWITAAVFFASYGQHNTGMCFCNQTVYAACNFFNAGISNGLAAKWKAVHLMPPLRTLGADVREEAAAFPQFSIKGIDANSPWGNTGGFSPRPAYQDLNGISTDGNGGLSELIITPFIPSTDWTDKNHFGISEYVYTNNSAYGFLDCGATGAGGTPAVEIATEYSDGKYYFISGANPGNDIIASVGQNPPPLGYYCNLRVSNTDFRTYFANNVTPFAQYGATQTTALSGSLPSVAMFIFMVNVNGAGSGNASSPAQLSYWSCHEGFTATDAQNEYNLVQTYLQQKGGGYH